MPPRPPPPARPPPHTPNSTSSPSSKGTTLHATDRPRQPTPAARPRREKEPIKHRLLEVCAHYLGGPGRALGARTTWPCPRCGKQKFEANAREGVAGCWNQSCAVPTTTDALGLIAFFEQLSPAREDFALVLEHGYRILGLDLDGPTAIATPTNSLAPSTEPPPALPPRAAPALQHAVYEALLDLCPLEDRDVRFLKGRGLSRATINAGRFASITARRARWALKQLRQRFGEDLLLSVPGFSKNAGGRLAFTLCGDYVLIPYYRRSRIVTIEGRYVGRGEGLAKYVSLRGSGAHLYVFPGLAPEDLEAFCEGPMGAIVAAQEGIRVGAIKGFRNHKSPGRDGGSLPELAGVDFAGRRLPYIPDVDDPPKSEVLDEAPVAAANLAGRQNGEPALLSLPEGKDLDEWLLSLPSAGRAAAFRELLLHAVALDPPPDAVPKKRAAL